MTMTMHAITIPTKVTPCCFSIDPPSLKSAEALRFTEVEPDKKRLADDILVRHETPYPAVGRIVAVVPHHEIMSRRHGAGHALAIVVAIFPERERPHEGNRDRK